MSGKKAEAAAKTTIKAVFMRQLALADFEKISVGGLVEAARVNKSTFYKYYASKYALLDELQDELFAGFGEKMAQAREDVESYKGSDVYPGFMRYFDYVLEHQDQYLLFSARMPGEFDRRHRASIMRYCLARRSAFDYWGRDPEMPEEIHAVIISNCYAGLIQYWLKTGLAMSCEEMGRLVTLLWKRLTGGRAEGK